MSTEHKGKYSNHHSNCLMTITPKVCCTYLVQIVDIIISKNFRRTDHPDRNMIHQQLHSGTLDKCQQSIEH